jgi:adenine modification enzyme
MQNKDYIYSNQLSLYGSREIIGFGDMKFYIKEIDRKLADDIIIKNHYSKKVVVVGHHKIDLGVFINDELLGVLQYGFAMNPQSCGNIVEGTNIDQYLELNRMWLSDKAIRNSESKAIGYSIKYIRGKFPKIKWIQSFADERCGGFGIVYQACSFSYYGEHISDFWELNGEFIHNSRFTNTNKKSNSRYTYYESNKDKANKCSLRQFRYIKFLDERWKVKCLLKEMPYPKHYNNLNISEIKDDEKAN